MEEDSSRPWSFSTNWMVSDGTLESCIRLETSISSDDERQDEAEDQASPMHQVVLSEPPASDSGPCEIEIRLAQRHEIRQVYVRSTARIFEIYFTNETSSNDYLCTVRCGIAAKEESILNYASETQKSSEDKTKNDNISINEDGWVEVKDPGSTSTSGSSDNSLERKMLKNTQRIQDFFEATAEISDSNPCVSLTLRLLSLKTKGCICLEEIYIFAEPADSYDSDYLGSAEDKSRGSNLVAMLVPTLLQLSKSGVSKIQERYNPDIGDKEGLSHHDGDAKETKSFDPNIERITHKEPQSSIPFGEEKNAEEASGGSAESTTLESCRPVPGMQGHEFVNDSSCSQTERLLERLLCQVGRIEAFCLGIEGNMLKSLGSIDTRLQQLEHQMELLAMRSQSAELYPPIRIMAPEFSCNDSETNSRHNDDHNCTRPEFSRRDTCERAKFFSNASESNSLINDGNDDLCCGGSESCQKNDTLSELSSFNHDTSNSLVAPQLSPHLIVSAPDFSVDENYYDGHSVSGTDDGPAVDVEENDSDNALEMSKKGCAPDKPYLSLDDALSCALAGFLCSTSAQPPNAGQKSIEVDCFPSDCSSNNHYFCSTPKVQCDKEADSDTCSGENNVTENVNETKSSPCNSIQVNNLQAMLNDGEESEGCCLDDRNVNTECEACENSSMEDKGRKAYALNLSEMEEIVESNSCMISGQTANWKGCVESGSDTMNSMLTEIRTLVRQNCDESYDITSTGAIACTDFENGRDELDNLPKPAFNGVVDFEFPILDVKFVQQKNWNEGSPLFGLLGDIQETMKGDFGAEENNGIALGAETNKIFKGYEPKVTELSEQLLVEVDHLSVKTAGSNMGDKQMEGLFGCSNQELFLSPSLI